jgi:hypothetical protein
MQANILDLARWKRRVFWPSTFVAIPIGGNQHVILSFGDIKGSGLPGFSYTPKPISQNPKTHKISLKLKI